MKMKKFLALVLAIVMACSIGMIAHADSDEQKSVRVHDGQIVPEDPIDLFIETLDDNLKAGTFMDENGEFVLAVTDLEKANNIIAKANLPEKIKLVEVKYSLADLEAARDNLFDKSEEFDIQIVAIHASKNALAVFTTDYSETNKTDIGNHITTYEEKAYGARNARSQGIDVVFYDNNGSYTNDAAEKLSEVASEESNISPRSLSTIRSGTRVWRAATSGAEGCIGWRMSVNGVTGYTTHGHNFTSTSNVFYEGVLLGRISRHLFSTSANTDVSFIPSTVPFFGMRRDGKKITQAGAPVQLSNIIFDGAGSPNRVTARIEATNGVANMLNAQGQSVRITNIIVFNRQPQLGDSGAAIIEERTGGVVRLVGFNSHQQKAPNDGTGQFNWGGAVTWTSVRNALGGSSVVSIMN